ncbi:MAG: histidine--tRNA ligase [Salinispira sp.]
MIITPQILKGFRDMLPEQELFRRQILRALEDTCRRFGFAPIDTPILEYSEVLLGKGGGETDKQIYRFEDRGRRDIAMRFDLTVPLARYMALHLNELYLPFRRYHFAKVFRGENPQRGRYREFIQCDFDIVGADSAAADFEILQLMYESFRALGLRRAHFRISHRGMFNRFLKKIDVDDHAGVLRAVDKLAKIGADKTRELLGAITNTKAAAEILEFIQADAGAAGGGGADGNERTLARMEELSGGESDDSLRMRSILKLAKEDAESAGGADAGGAKESADAGGAKESAGASGNGALAQHILIDPSITRGLDYYTGIVYETFLTDLPEIGSVCSGGRYNDLASLYTKTPLPGVGSSIGLDRLIAAMGELSAKSDAGSGIAAQAFFGARSADVLICMLGEQHLAWYTALARQFRKAGLNTEIYPLQRKLAQQFTYAEKKHIPLGIIAGETEIAENLLNYRDLINRESREHISIETAIDLCRQYIDSRFTR